MKYLFLSLLSAFLFANAGAQFSPDSIHTDFVMYQRRVDFDRNMRNRTIHDVFVQPLDGTTEEDYREACWAISQFLLRSADIENGFAKMFAGYSNINASTQRAFLEAVYGCYPDEYVKEVRALLQAEKNPKLFAMEVLYLFRAEKNHNAKTQLIRLIQERFPGYQQQPILQELQQYLTLHADQTKAKVPLVGALFQYRKESGSKTIYSFQRWNRDYPGMAIVQNADGSFCRDSEGRLLVFEQLARSASDLPYFITNGSTPQGIFSIQGTEVSHNNFIGPTPNIQLVMPNEADSLYWHNGYDSSKDAFSNYLSLLPLSWRDYAPVGEAFRAGKIGRTEIIAHGTTIDPDYFKDKPYYPLTPTLGCLCAKETWNIFNGRFEQSEQFRLVNTFLSTPGDKGFLFVINLDNQQKKITREEIEQLVNSFESKK